MSPRFLGSFQSPRSGEGIPTKTLDASYDISADPSKASHFTYDTNGNMTSRTDALGRQTSYQYNSLGQKVSMTTPPQSSNQTGATTNYQYDAFGNLTETDAPLGRTTKSQYDGNGNKTSDTDALGNVTGYKYDALNRLIETDYPDGTKKTYTYDGPGNLTLVTDQAGNQVQYSYDAANQLTNVVELNSPNTGNNTTIYGYDGDGNPIAFEDANTHTTSQSFDLLNELTGKTLPDNSLTETRTYDLNGNLKTVTHFNGTVTTYTYDSLNRLLSRSTPGEPTVSFTYTATGKRATMTDASGTTTYSYDHMDRLTSKATPEGTLSYAYDAAGNLQSIASSNANGASMSYTYDSLNRLKTVVDSRLGTTTYTYDGASNVYTVAYPNSVQAQYQYDAMNRLTGLATQQSGYAYQRGPAGNLSSGSELNGRAMTWSFDGIYRLTGETISGDPNSQNNGSVGYDLDPVGNRLSETSSLAGVPSGSWNYNADDELSSESYDQNGNVTAANGKAFAYDSQNELVSMNGGAVQIMYDGDGNRVAKSATAGGVTTTTYYLVDDLNPTGYPQVMDELNGSGVVTRTYTYGLQRISEDQFVNNTWTPSFYSYDGMGSVRQLTNTAGAITDSYDYDAFGNQISHTGTTPNNYLYRGEQWDPDLGLYYLRARYYNPLSGRFMSRDPNNPKPLDESGAPTDPKMLHKYLYANGNPIDLVDPTGRGALDEAALIGDVIIQRTIPGIVEFVGDFIELNVINPAKDAAEIVAEYAVDAHEILETNGLARWFACDELGSLSGDVFIDITESDSSDEDKEFDKEQVGKLFDKACGVFLFHEPVSPL